MKIFLRILAAFIALLLVLWLVFALFAAPYIKSTIENKLTYYQGDSVEIGSVNLHFFPIGLEVKDARFKLFLPMDSLLVQWQGNLSRAEVGGIDWYKAWKDKKWDVGKIEIGEGRLNWFVTKTTLADTSRFKTSTTKVKPDILLREVHVNELNLRLQRDSFAVNLQTSIDLDSLSIIRKDSVLWKLRWVVFHSEDASFSNVVTDYNLGYQSLDYDSRDSSLAIGGFAMKPRLTQAEFSKKYPFRKVQPDLRIGKISLLGIDLKRLNRGLFARKLVVDSCEFKIHQDIRKERPEERKLLPSEMIAKIPFPVEIDSLVVKNANLEYSHSAKPENGMAHLSADRILLKAFPISNIGHDNCADLNLAISARLQKKPTVKLQAHFFANRPDHRFEVDLSMTETPIPVFNDMLYPTLGITAKSGQCQGARAHMAGNDFEIRGDLDIAYSDLKIALPPEQKGNKKLLGKVAEGLGNFALVNTNNTMDADKGAIYFERPQKEPFVNFWWKGVESGLLDAIVRFYKNPDKE